MSSVYKIDPMLNWATKPPGGLDDPQPAPAPPPTGDDDPELEAARQEERDRLNKKRGRSSTLLTGPQGLAGPAPTQRKTLLGQ